MLTRRNLASGGGKKLNYGNRLSLIQRNTLTNWIHGVEKRGKKKHSGKLPDHSNRQAHTPLYDPFRLPLQLWSCPKVYKPLTAIFFFFFQAVKTERADDLWPAIAENVERRVSHRGTGRVDAVLFSGSELLRLAGWPCWQDGRLIVRLADDGAETWFKRNNSHVCFRK